MASTQPHDDIHAPTLSEEVGVLFFKGLVQQLITHDHIQKATEILRKVASISITCIFTGGSIS